MFVSDDIKAVVGTINLDYRSLYHHFECATYLYKTNCIADIEKDFDDIIDRGGQESVYNAILETIRFLEEQDAFPPDPDRAQLLRIYESLNREGRQRLADYAADLSSIENMGIRNRHHTNRLFWWSSVSA